MPIETLEQRVQRVEDTLQKVQEQLALQSQNTLVQKRGWRWFVGIYAESPDFDEVVQIGQEWRNADRPKDAVESK